MFYAIFVPPFCDLPNGVEERPCFEDLVFSEIKEANAALKLYKGSRMKTFPDRERALAFLQNPELEESFLDLDTSSHDINLSFERLSIQQNQNHQPSSSPRSQKLLPQTANSFTCERPVSDVNSHSISSPKTESNATTTTSATAADEAEPVFPTAKPALLNSLRRKIEAGDYDCVEQNIWLNPRCLVSVCDSAIYLMAGPKYNACHIAARANKPDIMALLLDTITNFSFLRKLYPNETDTNIQDRVNHLLDSYLNTPDPRQGNTPLHFACKLGHYRVVRVLLTFEGCDLSLKDSNGQTAEQSICIQYKPPVFELVDQFSEKMNLNDEDESGSKDNGTSDNRSSNADLLVKHESETQISNVRRKIKNMFKQHFHLPLYRDQLKKRLILERRRSRASSQVDSDTSFSDIDDSFITNSPTK